MGARQQTMATGEKSRSKKLDPVESKSSLVSSPSTARNDLESPIWERLPPELLVKIIPWSDNRAVESSRRVCRTWRQTIDAFISIKEKFIGDSLNIDLWNTEKLNTEVFHVDWPMRGYLRRETKHLSKRNQWSVLRTKQFLHRGTVICYMLRFPVSWGSETKFTVTGGAILRRSIRNSFTWQWWDGRFHDIKHSTVSPGKKWYSIAHEVVSDGVITYEEGQRLFKHPCQVPQEEIEGILHLQHLDIGSAVCMDIANLFIVKL